MKTAYDSQCSKGSNAALFTQVQQVSGVKRCKLVTWLLHSSYTNVLTDLLYADVLYPKPHESSPHTAMVVFHKDQF